MNKNSFFYQWLIHLNLNSLDFFFIMIFVFFAFWGYKKQFFGQIFPILAIVSGFYFAYAYYDFISIYILSSLIQDKILLWHQFYLNDLFAFIFIFIFINYVINRMNHFFLRGFQFLYLSWLNSLLGIFLGLLKAYVLIFLFLYLYKSLKLDFLAHLIAYSKIRYWILNFSFQAKIINIKNFIMNMMNYNA